jgi:transcriptional regulator with GAF, ATPase, and Fis domain
VAVFPASVAGLAAPLGRRQLVVGREPGDGGLLVEHETVSRRHLAVGWDERRRTHVAADLGSHNGSYLQGDPVDETPQPLADGAVLRLGDAFLIYEQGPPADEGIAAGVSREAAPGEARTMSLFRARLARAAADPAALLLIGETGTGKERIAAEIHRLSGRPGPLVPVNCAALSPQLVESQLFGHSRGAFTGASSAHSGLFRAADRGTLFLDEVGELPLEMQPKFLRAIELREIQPVGVPHPMRVDVRIVAATNRDLAGISARGLFRADLYARLSTWELHLPALRDRRVDLFGWIERLHRIWAAERAGGALPPLSADTVELLLRYDWPLNLRSVDRLVHELAALNLPANETVSPARLPPWLSLPAPPGSAPVPQATTMMMPAAGGVSGGGNDHDSARQPVPTRAEFVAAFDELEGSVRGLAKLFKRDRRQIYRWIESYGLKERRSR